MDTNIKCVAIDDEPLALQIIDNFCQRIGGIDLVTFSDPQKGLDYIRQHQPKIAFLDIEMDDINGLMIASQLPPETCFIFTTAYLEYAVDGFNLDAVDYLHKPIAFPRFQTAFDRALRRINAQKPPTPQRSANITVKKEYQNVTIPLAEILYIEAMEGYVKIYRDNGTCTLSRMILKNILPMLPEDEFVRIHRSYIVHRSKIKSYNRSEVVLSNGQSLPIGRKYSPLNV
ncbi:MAG: LytTR family DNA-binding domain-containing protein [Bacteroidales bacterium]|nr:LytTR family DNA-binding domain-containing protein [Bacteroidales bacterium]